ncbi:MULTISPECIES: ATP-binding protein [Cryobacterium]|uniref:ATP-binding protein n=1 Tax=Cryobacterium TaxID=69578 RepID=UPI001F547668|nr:MULTISPECIES: ATP-binding protein [Cryobacterium]
MTGSEVASQIEYYARALRAPRISEAFRRLGDQARDAGWSHEEYLAAVLSKEVFEREASGAALRIKAARFPGHKILEDFNFDHQPSADRNLIAHLGTSVFPTEAKNVVLLGPPGTGKTRLAVGIGIKAAKAGRRGSGPVFSRR